jgi:hypothetical protein
LADPIRVAMPAPGAELRGYFDERVASGSLDLALDLSVVEFDELAQLAGVAVTAVDTSGAGIAVHYAVSWTSFHACDDRTFGGAHARVLRGRAEGGEWVFERHEPLPTQRDFADEF